MLQFIDKMVIDEDRNYILTNYKMRKGQNRPIESDHNPLILDLNISFEKSMKERVDIYNLRSKECQQIFKEVTTRSSNLSDCFLDGNPLMCQVKSWEINFTNAIKQSFKRIRITDMKKDSKSHELMAKRRSLNNQLKTATDVLIIQKIQNDVTSIEMQLSSLLAENNLMKIKDNLAMLTETDGSSSCSGVWKLTKKLFPKHAKPLPIAKKDLNGRLISSPEELKNLYINTYKHRLRSRPVKPEYQQLRDLKEELCQKRLQLVKMKPYQPWKMQDLEKVIKS